MSWSGDVSFDYTSPQEGEDLIRAIKVQGNECPERDEQVAVAKEAAIALFKSGAVGAGPGKRFAVNLGGHANRNHEPDPAYANDYVSLQVVQIQPKVVT